MCSNTTSKVAQKNRQPTKKTEIKSRHSLVNMEYFKWFKIIKQKEILQTYSDTIINIIHIKSTAHDTPRKHFSLAITCFNIDTPSLPSIAQYT